MTHTKMTLVVTSEKFPEFVETFEVDKVETGPKTNVILRREGKITSIIEDTGSEVIYTNVYPGMGVNQKNFQYHELQELRALCKLIDRNNDVFEFLDKAETV